MCIRDSQRKGSGGRGGIQPRVRTLDAVNAGHQSPVANEWEGKFNGSHLGILNRHSAHSASSAPTNARLDPADLVRGNGNATLGATRAIGMPPDHPEVEAVGARPDFQ